MANLHDIFLQYRKTLDVATSRFERLKLAEISIKNQLRRYFSNLPDYNIHHFKLQGSKSMGTLIRKNDSVDIDLGVYFYPKPNIKPKTLMEHVYKALHGLRTQSPPIRKKRCIRVIYSESINIHIDVPIFYIERTSGNRSPHLATRNGWIESDVSEFEKWFNEKKKRNLQLIQIIRYLKDWANNKPFNMPNGVTMTVLASKYYFKNERDDVAFLETLKNIKEGLLNDFSCIIPAKPYDDLLEETVRSFTKKNKFLESLEGIILDGQKALKVRDKEIGINLWKKHLGKNFNRK